MNLLSNPHINRGAIAILPTFIAAMYSERDSQQGTVTNVLRCALSAVIMGVAVAAISAALERFGVIKTCLALGATIGAIYGVNELTGQQNPGLSDRVGGAFTGAFYGAAIMSVALLVCYAVVEAFKALAKMELKGWAIVDGRFVPIYGPKN